MGLPRAPRAATAESSVSDDMVGRMSRSEEASDSRPGEEGAPKMGIRFKMC